MGPKREALATAHTPEELLDQQQAKATELRLVAPPQNERNAWGPIFANSDYDLRIDKRVDTGQYVLYLMHKLKPGGLLAKFRKR